MSTRVIVIIVVAVVFMGIGIAVGNNMAKKKAAKQLEASNTPAVTEDKAAA